MKKMNLLVMSLVSAAALSFSSCSSNDDLGGGAGTQSQVDGFYMTLAIQTPTSNGTRTVPGEDKTTSASTEEQTVTKGTFFLVDQKGHIAFISKVNSSSQDGDEKLNGTTESQKGTKIINIKVEKVAAGTTYKVYFLAGDHQIPADVNPAAHTFTATEEAGKFAEPFAKANNFAMFNQNDKNVNGNGYTVVFTKDNKDKEHPAQVTYKNDTEAVPNAPIKIERITARIDAPTSGTATTIVDYDGTKQLTQAVKDAMADAKAKVKSITLNKYAIANLTNKTNVMQQWNATWDLQIPKGTTPVWQVTDKFGEEKLYADGGFKTATEAPNNYVLENNSTTDPTKMYFEYKVTLNDDLAKDGVADFTDGTFYRYNNIIFSSFKQIFQKYNDVADIFAPGKTADAMKGELTTILKMPAGTERETALKTFRETYDIEVFDKGMTYYQKEIVDKNILAAGKSLIQRNTIYKVNVDKIFNIGVQVPNGEDEIEKKSLFYLEVTVSVNPWVLNTQNVELGD